MSYDAKPQDTGPLLTALKQAIRGSNEEALDLQLESAAKHVPAYLKIVKGHIEQLSQVLATDSHNRRTLDTVNLAEPVTQLMKIFDILEPNDIQIIENLAAEARHWPSQMSPKETQTLSELDEVQEYT